jgi:hypothetical protein
MSITTLAIGEEGSFSVAGDGPTTLVAGEEDPKPTTLSLGEEEPEPTTLSLAEEDAPKSFEGGVVDPFGAF